MANLDWTNLGFGYRKTNTILSCSYKDGEWGAVESHTDDNLTISAFAGALHYSVECFEGLKAFRGKDGKVRIFRPEENARRLQSSAASLFIPEPPVELFVSMCKRLVKENIDYLMILVHDLKHEIADINDIDKSQRIQKLNDDLISFSTFYKTGNDVLDLVLAERKHKLSIHEITTTVMADGSSISFMNSSDIYALFMNMFDNAIDALLKVQNHANRTISLSIRKHMGLIFIHEENPYCGSIKFKDDIPMTDKKESIEHGYGSLSIKRIAQKYGGYVNYDVDDGVFKIDIVLDPSTTLKCL